MSTSIIEPGTRLAGRYRLEERVSESGGSTLWKAIDEILARAVAVRTFDPDFRRAGEVVTAARAASRLTDPRLTQVFDADDSGERAYVVSEWAVGESLEEMLATSPLEPGRAATLLYEAAEAIAAAHAAGLAHLRLCPRDLLWTNGGTVKLLGIAVDAVLADLYADDPAKEDVQGIARMLYAALTAHWPGDPATSGLPAAPTRDGAFCAPRQVRAGVPLALDILVCRALGLPVGSGEEPLTTPAELAKALRGVPRTPLPLFAGPVLGPPPSVVPRPSRPAPAPSPAPPVRSVPAATAAEPPPPPRARTRTRSMPPAGAPQPKGAGAPPSVGGPSHAPARQPVSRPLIALAAAAVTVIVGISAWALTRGDKDGDGTAGGQTKPPSTGPQQPGKTSQKLSILGAQAFDEPRPGREANRDNKIHSALGALHDSRPTSIWQSQSYRSANFGNYLKGLGVRLDMGNTVTVDRIKVLVPGAGAGAGLEVMIGDDEALPLLRNQKIANQTTTAGLLEITPKRTTRGRYILLWFHSLPAGSLKAQIGEVTVQGTK